MTLHSTDTGINTKNNFEYDKMIEMCNEVIKVLEYITMR